MATLKSYKAPYYGLCMESKCHNKKIFPNDLGIAPALMKHVSDRFELILKHFNFLVKTLYDFNVAILAIL